MELQTFNNTQFGELRAVQNNDGSISVNLEDVARGLGFTTVATSGNKVIRWSRVRKYLEEFGVSEPLDKDSFIPESTFYLLAMKASNESAKKFQIWVATEVLPAIRKTGSYNIPSTPEEKLDLLVEVAHNQKDKVEKIDERVTHLETNARIDPTQYGYIGSLVNKRLQAVKEVYKYDWNKQQCGVLRHGINKDICSAMNARPRTQIRAKDFDKACTFIEGWNPSSVTLKEIEELAGE